MKTKFISDSTFLFEHQGCRILTDPWIGTTIYGGAWMQFPPPVCTPKDIGPLDYIFISHIHEDHCDPKTISELDRNAKIVIMGNRPNFIAKFLDRHGFHFKDIIVIPPFEPTEIASGLSIEMIDADPSQPLAHMIDSSMILHTGGKSVFFANDNPPYEVALGHLSKYDYSLALLPAAGGAGYPACYDSLSDARRREERDRIRLSYYQVFASTIQSLQPDRFMPVAGYHVISGRNHAINEQMSFLSDPAEAFSVVYDSLSQEQRNRSVPIQLAPGAEFDTTQPVVDAPEAWRVALQSSGWRDRKAEFLNTVASTAEYDHDSLTLPADLDWGLLFSNAAENLLSMSKANGVEFSSNIYVRLPAKGPANTGFVNGADSAYSIVSHDDERIEPYLEVSADETMLFKLLTGEFSWNIADAACFVRYVREPNIFDQPAFIALNYLNCRSSS